ncbi:hypothetical protein, partial [Flavobacterium sp.]|uniref:hypothetical protein n=1 Tax=Flavobacterium sp. TaxID=239 RepID=UPI00391CC90E
VVKFLDGKELVFLFVEAFFDFFEVQAGLGVGFACDALYIFGIDANSGCFHGGYNLKVNKYLCI